jgi:hypothetical protein
MTWPPGHIEKQPECQNLKKNEKGNYSSNLQGKKDEGTVLLSVTVA